MKKVYITYNRYEKDEFYEIYNVTTRLSDLRKNYVNNLYDFLRIGPDDCCSYNIIKVNLSNEDYETLMKFSDNHDPYDNELIDLMVRITDNLKDEDFLLMSGCEDNPEIVRFCCEYNNEDPDDDEVFDNMSDRLYNSETLYEVFCKMYIKYTYQI